MFRPTVENMVVHSKQTSLPRPEPTTPPLPETSSFHLTITMARILRLKLNRLHQGFSSINSLKDSIIPMQITILITSSLQSTKRRDEQISTITLAWVIGHGVTPVPVRARSKKIGRIFPPLRLLFLTSLPLTTWMSLLSKT
ncbi:hypothetical protein ACJ72_07705 [Emergomyces africanus]|uniref:Uncharacterized protein n=1 Tax=Emergomyces africanus TaxID=1955775 RepID=A0A1B7NN13_9EURO|nr:hypothetical protein ACJ72_07705 [Emergomyces africanus]